MTEELSDLVYPVLDRALGLLDQVRRGQHPDFTTERERIQALIAQAERRAEGTAALARDFPQVKRALVYWVDEVLINSDWKHRVDWEANTLEWEYYAERIRAVKFYEVAGTTLKLRETGPLEVFLLALGLGFRGKLRPTPEALEGEARLFLERFHERNKLAKFGEDGPRFARLAPLPGPTLLLAVSALVFLTALITLLGFLGTHAPWKYWG